MSSDSSVGRRLSALQLFRSLLLVTLVLFTRLVFLLVLCVLVIAAQVVPVTKFELLIIEH